MKSNAMRLREAAIRTAPSMVVEMQNWTGQKSEPEPITTGHEPSNDEATQLIEKVERIVEERDQQLATDPQYKQEFDEECQKRRTQLENVAQNLKDLFAECWPKFPASYEIEADEAGYPLTYELILQVSDNHYASVTMGSTEQDDVEDGIKSFVEFLTRKGGKEQPDE